MATKEQQGLDQPGWKQHKDERREGAQVELQMDQRWMF